jgi:acetyltransferase-like isoleucine patch superfamily enzyme/glycosyltransferase involved in cell wall biosynthesis
MSQTLTTPVQSSATGPVPAGPRTVPVSVVILTLNEEVNIGECLRSCAWCDDVHVVDSGSTDRTVEIAKAMGAKVYYHPFESFGKQRNWAIENCPTKHEWIFHLDADERFTPELVSAMRDLIASDPPHAGFHVPSKFMFMGTWLKRTATYPTYQMRLFHKGRMRFRDWGHGQREETQGTVGTLDVPYLHYALSKGIAEWFERHNRYSTLEAIEAARRLKEPMRWGDLFLRDRVRRRRALKELLYRMPGRAFLRYLATLFVLGAILEGKAGRTYARMLYIYEQMITQKLRLIRERERRGENAGFFEADGMPAARPVPLARAESGTGEAVGVPSVPPVSSAATGAHPGTMGGHPEPPSLAEFRGDVRVRAGGDVPALEPLPTPWTRKQRLVRLLWMFAGRPLFRMSFHNWFGFRAWLLRRFGAQVGRDVRLRPTVAIEIPWNLVLHDGATCGDHAILYSLGMIEIGERATVSQYAHLCAGTHDYTDRRLPLLREPIVIGAGAWIGADAFVGPGVRVGHLAVLGARSSAFKDLDPETVYVGSPARALKKRELR